jgi:hypothetical protein
LRGVALKAIVTVKIEIVADDGARIPAELSRTIEGGPSIANIVSAATELAEKLAYEAI